MKILEKFGFCGIFELTKRDKNTRKILKYIKKDNLIMNAALDELIKSMYNPNSDMQLKYIAIGDDNTAAAASQTTLESETYRVPIITKIRSGTGEFYVRAILKDYQPEDGAGITTIKEVGTFAGSNANQWNDGGGANSGLMISRIVLTTPESKTDDEEIELKWTYEIARG